MCVAGSFPFGWVTDAEGTGFPAKWQIRVCVYQALSKHFNNVICRGRWLCRLISGFSVADGECTLILPCLKLLILTVEAWAVVTWQEDIDPSWCWRRPWPRWYDPWRLLLNPLRDFLTREGGESATCTFFMSGRMKHNHGGFLKFVWT